MCNTRFSLVTLCRLKKRKSRTYYRPTGKSRPYTLKSCQLISLSPSLPSFGAPNSLHKVINDNTVGCHLLLYTTPIAWKSRTQVYGSLVPGSSLRGNWKKRGARVWVRWKWISGWNAALSVKLQNYHPQKVLLIVNLIRTRIGIVRVDY